MERQEQLHFPMELTETDYTSTFLSNYPVLPSSQARNLQVPGGFFSDCVGSDFTQVLGVAMQSDLLKRRCELLSYNHQADWIYFIYVPLRTREPSARILRINKTRWFMAMFMFGFHHKIDYITGSNPNPCPLPWCSGCATLRHV